MTRPAWIKVDKPCGCAPVVVEGIETCACTHPRSSGGNDGAQSLHWCSSCGHATRESVEARARLNARMAGLTPDHAVVYGETRVYGFRDDGAPVVVVDTGLPSWRKPEPQWCGLCCCDCTDHAVVFGDVSLCVPCAAPWRDAAATPAEIAVAVADLVHARLHRMRAAPRPWQAVVDALDDAPDVLWSGFWDAWTFRPAGT